MEPAIHTGRCQILQRQGQPALGTLLQAGPKTLGRRVNPISPKVCPTTLPQVHKLYAVTKRPFSSYPAPSARADCGNYSMATHVRWRRLPNFQSDLLAP